jgi:Uncharacterised nucleotidyltransferase
MPFHEQILKTALLPGARTRAEWEKLRTTPHDLWTLDASQLLPMLSRALVDAGIEDPDVPKLMQAARRTWLSNQVVFRELDAALEVLDSAGVRAMALKGVPLALRHYRDPSLRPMVDFDLLVDPAQAPDAVTALRRGGWALEWTLDEDFVARTCEVPCRSPDGRGILDLHWRLVPWVGRTWTNRDPDLWREAVPLPVANHVTRSPADHDLLLHVILHAYKSGWARVPWWVADVVVVLRSSGNDFDWDRFVNRVLHARLALPVAEALEYVTTTFDAPVPEPVRVTLAAARSTRREHHKHRRAERTMVARRHWLFGEVVDLSTDWARISVNFSRAGELSSLRPFLRGRMHVDHLWTLPFAITWRRLRRQPRLRTHAGPEGG